MIACVVPERVLIVVIVGVGGVWCGEGKCCLLEHHVLVLKALEQIAKVLVLLLR